jgi:hypothetical protein
LDHWGLTLVVFQVFALDFLSPFGSSL